MTASDGCVDRAAIASELEGARLELHRLLDATGADDWRRSTNGTRWTNEQLLFHMVFGYMIVARLLPLVRLFGRLPERVSAGYARLLDAGTVPFHAVNFYGSCAAARVYNRHRMGAKLAASSRRCNADSPANPTETCTAACTSPHAGTRTSATG